MLGEVYGAEVGAGGDIAKAIGDPVGTLVGLLAGFAPEAPVRTGHLLIEILCAALTPFIYKYYFGVLGQGAAAEGSIERPDYEKLRASLEGDNLAARLYVRWLKIGLDKVDRFFGDAGQVDRTLFPHGFGLKTPAPPWTVAQALLAWGLIFHVMPWIELDLLDMARAVTAFDLPTPAYLLFARR